VNRVLVPHATNRAALTIIRSLGRRGCDVVASGPTRWCLGGASRFARQVLVHPDPMTEPEAFADAVAESIRRFEIEAVFPPSDATLHTLVDLHDRLPRSAVLLAPPAAALDLAHDKVRLVELASQLGVPVPRSIVYEAGEPTGAELAEIGFPLVVKPRRSLLKRDGHWEKSGVLLVENAMRYRSLLAERPSLREGGHLLQEKVPGEGRGVFLLAKDGQVRSIFAHRRIRETPPWGGVATLCEAAQPEAKLADYAERLVRALRWTGVLMVEFKWDPSSQRAWLMEINGRVWGSMQLAVECGLDFPWLLLAQETQGDTGPIGADRSDVRLWWLVGDASHFAARLRSGGAGAIPGLLRDLSRTRQGRRLRMDTLQAGDPVPFAVEAWESFSRVVLRRRSAVS
jgi:predicted ATP-grasp superfamily ATP-dependent carboligase